VRCLQAPSRPIDPVFRADGVVLAISVEKDGNLRVVYAGSENNRGVMIVDGKGVGVILLKQARNARLALSRKLGFVPNGLSRRCADEVIE
jgi:hypothetical protein